MQGDRRRLERVMGSMMRGEGGECPGNGGEGGSNISRDLAAGGDALPLPPALLVEACESVASPPPPAYRGACQGGPTWWQPVSPGVELHPPPLHTGEPVKVVLLGGSLSLRGWNYPDESFIRQLHKWLELTFIPGCRCGGRREGDWGGRGGGEMSAGK